jgi:tetratricopeptide (TPR) repeat protein
MGERTAAAAARVDAAERRMGDPRRTNTLSTLEGRMRTAFLLSLLATTSLAAGQATPGKPSVKPPPAGSPAVRPDVAKVIRDRVESTLKVLDDDQKYPAAYGALQDLFDQTIWYAPEDVGLLTEAAGAIRLVQAFSQWDKPERRETFAAVRKSPALARAMAFLPQSRRGQTLALNTFVRLQQAHGDKLAQFPTLTAALCHVHGPAPVGARAAGEEEQKTIEPAELFRYYTENESRMLFPIREMPTELLAMVVNTTADIDELRWALDKHGGDRNVGKRYSDLTYDTAAFKFNKPKKIADKPYSLPNLRKYGGVCEEQAYYAAHVAKAIGVPSAYITGRAAEASHAWVGFLQQRGGSYWFNCEEGRYDEYEELRGQVGGSPWGGGMSQSQLEIMAALMGTPAEQRYGAVALMDAALRMKEREHRSAPRPPVGGAELLLKANDARAQIRFLERGTNLSPGNPEVWLAALGWAKDFTTEERTRWFAAAAKACKGGDPDFAYQIASKLVEGMEDPRKQVPAWEWLSKQHTAQRPDLSAGALISMGDCWKKAGEKERAYSTFREVALKHINDGPFALTAVQKAAEMLEEAGKSALLLELYEEVFKRTQRPEQASAGFFRGTNFYRLGTRYAEALDVAGRTRDAERVRRQISAGEEPEMPFGRN